MRQVRHNGEIRWRNETIYINQALAGEPVALDEDATGWTVSYGPIVLGMIAHNDNRLRKPKPKKGKSCGHVDDARASPTSPQDQQQQT